MDNFYENRLPKGGLHPLGMNQGKGPLVVLLQDATWRPNQFVRTGTFHKRLQGRWISFGLTTKASVSAEADEVYLELEVENRQEQALELTVCPEQRKGQPGDAAESIAYTLKASTLRFGKFQTTVVSDLGDPRDGGWPMRIPRAQKRTARFAIVVQPADVQTPSLHAGDLAARIQRADDAVRRRLRWASDRLPRVTTENGQFDEFYRRCVLSVLECRWERKNFAVHPFYAIGNSTFTLAWDTSFASEMLAILDPEGLRSAFLAYVRAGLLKASWIRWDGVSSGWYAQTPFAAMRILLEYLTQTGDVSLLDHSESGATVFESLKKAGQELHGRFARPDGLLDFGEGSGKMLEIRTEGYEHVVAASNGMAVDYFRQLAQWCRRRNDPDAAQFEQWAAEIHKAMNEQLWNEKAGWFENLYPDGTRHLFLSYHQFDLLDGDALSPAQRRAMTSQSRKASSSDLTACTPCLGSIGCIRTWRTPTGAAAVNIPACRCGSPKPSIAAGSQTSAGIFCPAACAGWRSIRTFPRKSSRIREATPKWTWGLKSPRAAACRLSSSEFSDCGRKSTAHWKSLPPIIPRWAGQP